MKREKLEMPALTRSTHIHLCQKHVQSTGARTKLGLTRVSNLTYKNSQCLAKEVPVSHARPFSPKLCDCINLIRVGPPIQVSPVLQKLHLGFASRTNGLPHVCTGSEPMKIPPKNGSQQPSTLFAFQEKKKKKRDLQVRTLQSIHK